MALINCPECGKEVSEELSKCIHCGYKLKKININKKYLMIALIAVLIVASLFFISGNRLSKDEKVAIEVCKNLQLSLKDKKSLELYEVYVNDGSAVFLSSNSYNTIVYISYGAKNSYGGIVNSEIIYLIDDYGTTIYRKGDSEKGDATFLLAEEGIYGFVFDADDSWHKLSNRQIKKIYKNL